uniref:MRP1 n=1 Tax=Arundo donax TaxID=35708 RepID=A0A0A9F445_ARUDO
MTAEGPFAEGPFAEISMSLACLVACNAHGTMLSSDTCCP